MSRVKVSALVANCSARKSAKAAAELSSAALTSGIQDAVARQWMDKVAAARATAKASELYMGRGVKRMHQLADRFNVPLYIASAGLGLLTASEIVPSYDLSVSSGNPAAVQRRIIGGFVAQHWWAAVQQSKYARPISDLFRKHDRGLVLIAVSNAYVPLLVGDLSKLPNTQRDRLRLFGAADAKYPADLRPFLMPYDARLDLLVRGSKVDFAQRAAEHFLLAAATEEAFPIQLDEQRKWVEVELSRVTVKAREKREAVDDVRIREIAKELAHQGLSYTKALNTLRRQHGIACEQSRFRRLFLEATT